MTGPVASISSSPTTPANAGSDAKANSNFGTVLEAKLLHSDSPGDRTQHGIPVSGRSAARTRSAQAGKQVEPAEEGEVESAARRDVAVPCPGPCSASVVVSEAAPPAAITRNEAPEVPQTSPSLPSEIVPAPESSGSGSNVVAAATAESGNAANRPSEADSDLLASLSPHLNFPSLKAGTFPEPSSTSNATIAASRVLAEIQREGDATCDPAEKILVSTISSAPAASSTMQVTSSVTGEPVLPGTVTVRRDMTHPAFGDIREAEEAPAAVATRNPILQPADDLSGNEAAQWSADIPLPASHTQNTVTKHRIPAHDGSTPLTWTAATEFAESRAPNRAENASSPLATSASSSWKLPGTASAEDARTSSNAKKESDARASVPEHRAGDVGGSTIAKEGELNSIGAEGISIIQRSPAQAVSTTVSGEPQSGAEAYPLRSSGDELQVRPGDPAVPSLPGSVHMARLMDKVGRSEMHIGLHTSSFGAVEVHTIVRDTQVGLAFASEKGDLRSVIAPEMPALESSFRKHDLRLESLQFLDLNASYSSGERSGSGEDSRTFRPFQPFGSTHDEKTPTETSIEVTTVLQSRKGLNLHA